MPSPSERLSKVIAAFSPSEVKFKAGPVKGGSFILESYVTKPAVVTTIDSEAALQDALEEEIQELWDQENGKYYVSATVDALWSTIKRTILREYEGTSKRCAATKRKTEQFIRDIKIDDKYLPTFLVQTFLIIKSDVYEYKSQLELEAMFEQFESLRRNYGKRS